MKDPILAESVQVVVTGLVQGVGFRPFVYRMALKYDLSGWVRNTNESVIIGIAGSGSAIGGFLESLRSEAPPAALVGEITLTPAGIAATGHFEILASHDVSDEITEISPDIAVCEECLADMDRPGSRLDYAFVNCTNCGPRFTIIRDLPYDRAKTTMEPFAMCPQCAAEYDNVTDRRFHAQPVACSTCGPAYTLHVDGRSAGGEIGTILDQAASCIENGGIILIRGLGGMHLACDAGNGMAVARLRSLKNRDGKPFAVMFRDVRSLRDYAEISKAEEQSLLSWRRPIVLLRKRRPVVLDELAPGLNSGLNLLGVMLPYMPVHHLLFRRLKVPAIVLTSGNFSSEPILIDNDVALKRFSPLVDALLLHNRDIYNRTDDSVVRIMGGRERILRRSRGYVPSPVHTGFDAEGIVAFGAELTNCFCMGKGMKAFLSQHIGDLQSLETAVFYEETINQFKKLFRIKPTLVAVDMHPSYISTRTGLTFGDLPVVAVQHHHAHIASCMAEHRLDEKVIGIALDGTGYGTDGNTWGGEFLVCDLSDFTRFTHFAYMPLPGGDMAVEKPWRMAVSYLYRVYGPGFRELGLPMLQSLDQDKVLVIMQMIDKEINCPLTSGAGRLFDAVASLTGLVQVATFQAEGPMRLESLVQEGCTHMYNYALNDAICFDETIRGIVEDLLDGVAIPVISAKFHNTLIAACTETALAMRRATGIGRVVLSGGVFQNKYLLEGLTGQLSGNNFDIYSHAAVPANDGGIALGQLAVAAKRREMKCV